MQEIYDKAQELADLIVESTAYKTLREAEELVEGNTEVTELVGEFNGKAQRIAEKERTMEPVEPDEKQEFQDVSSRIQENPLLQRLLQAQADYAMMMNKVNNILQSTLEGKPAVAE